MTPPAKNGNSVLRTVLIAAVTVVILPGILVFFIWLARATIDIQARLTAVEGSIGRIEINLKQVNDAATAAAAAERARSAARISELEGIERTRDRAANPAQ